VSFRRRSAVFTVALATSSLLMCCSEHAKYRVLSFLFDGVPKPVAEGQENATPSDEPESDQSAESNAVQRAPVEKSYAHPPFRENRCQSCHNLNTGRLFKTPEAGLCTMCHTDPPGDDRYVHGPVNANACLFCHHPHASPFPKVLLAPPNDLCHRCHDADDLTTGTYHATIDQQTCIECHDPHGGNNRFFLKEDKP